MYKFKDLRKKVTHSKVYLQRTMSWLSMANAGMILFLVLSKLQDYGYEIYITYWIIPIYLLFFLLLILFGFIEDKLGFHREEKKLHEERSPYVKELFKRMDRLERKINGLKK